MPTDRGNGEKPSRVVVYIAACVLFLIIACCGVGMYAALTGGDSGRGQVICTDYDDCEDDD